MDEQLEHYLFGGKRKTVLELKNKEYIFDKLIFYILVLILLASSVTYLSMNGMDKSQHIYLNCPEKYVRCFNPYYQSVLCGKELPYDSYLCTQEIIDAPYTYGKPEPFFLKNFQGITIALIFLGFVINHLIYNRKFNLKEELKNVQ